MLGSLGSGAQCIKLIEHVQQDANFLNAHINEMKSSAAYQSPGASAAVLIFK